MAKEKTYEVKDLAGAWSLAKGMELAGGTLSFELLGDPNQKGIVGSALWREVIEGTEFTCPKCGSHAFGTYATQGPSAEHTTSVDGKYRGMCHGRVTVQRFTGRHQTNPTEVCDFDWQRSEEEDAKVFKGTGHYSPAVGTAVVVKQA